MQQYIGFKLGKNEFTIPILKVREIINTPMVTKLPQSPHYMRGIINLRGKIIPVVDLKEIVAMGEENGEGKGTKVIVLSTGRSTFGILVDMITSVINIDESTIEPPEDFLHEHIERIEGVARYDDRLIILLDTNKLVDMDEIDMFGGSDIPVESLKALPAEPKAPAAPEQASVTADTEFEKQTPPPISVPPPPPSPHPVEVKVTATAATEVALPKAGIDLQEAADVLVKKAGNDESKVKAINNFQELVDALTAHDFEQAELILQGLSKSTETEGDLYKEIGRVTRKLHDSVSEFRTALDPRIKQLANDDVPNAVDNLLYVISKTEEAANKTMAVVENNMTNYGEYAKTIAKLQGPPEAVAYLKSYGVALQNDMTTILLAQEFQDITGQSIRKVIDLVNTIETELVGLIATFGIKSDSEEASAVVAEKVSQTDVEDLLKEFGF